ncbi:MAG: Abortive infection protein [Gemmatimonadetes bacterium]|nr:Abortive infection protein [Gemmatimonadota bacterium]
MQVTMYSELAAALGATVLMLRLVDHRPWRDLGLAKSSATTRAWITGLGIGGAANLFVCSAVFVAGVARFEAAPAETSWVGAAFRVTIVLLPAALAEEVICRGYLFTVIRDSIGAKGAVVVTSVMFGLLHLANPGADAQSVFIVILAGVWLATVRIALDSLYAAWMAHLAWNVVMAVPFHAAVSAQRFEAPGYRAVMLEPAWLSGGSWGPEGGMFAALGLAGALGYFYARRRREES